MYEPIAIQLIYAAYVHYLEYTGKIQLGRKIILFDCFCLSQAMCHSGHQS